MTISRRYFLKSGGMAMIGMALCRRFCSAPWRRRRAQRKKLVVLFQRGAADGLNIVVPFAEPNYYRIRPTIAIPAAAPRWGRRCARPRRIFRLASEPRAAAASISKASWRSCTPRVRRTRRARISTRRTTWNRARRA